MAGPTRNVFSSLNRYAHRQEENFLTESLAYILEVLLLREPLSLQHIFNLLAGLDVTIDQQELRIITQESTETGRPDLVLEQIKEFTVFVEIKHDSPLGVEQLEHYLEELTLRPGAYHQLVLLTRSRHSMRQTSLDPQEYRLVCWYQIAGLLSELPMTDPVPIYLVDEFLSFLEEKEMSMEKVEWEYIRGVPAMRHLANMLGTAIAETLPDMSVTKTAGWSWIGYYLAEDFFIGFRYNDNMQIVVENDRGNKPSLKKTLNLEKSHFFALEAGEQLETLINFVSNATEELEINPAG